MRAVLGWIAATAILISFIVITINMQINSVVDVKQAPPTLEDILNNMFGSSVQARNAQMAAHLHIMNHGANYGELTEDEYDDMSSSSFLCTADTWGDWGEHSFRYNLDGAPWAISTICQTGGASSQSLAYTTRTPLKLTGESIETYTYLEVGGELE